MRPNPARGVTAINDQQPQEGLLGESTNLRLVRLRLFLALITIFAIPIAIAAPVIQASAIGDGTSVVMPTLVIIALAARLGLATAPMVD